MTKTFNLYCDESCHLENDKMPYMLMGYISVPYHTMEVHKEYIKALKKKHHFFCEIKWEKVSKSKFEFYKDLIDYFFASDMTYRCLIIDKGNIKNDIFGQTYDDFYYKMYWQLIYHQLDMTNKYNIYLDIKDTLSAAKVQKLKTILNVAYTGINNLQNIRSDESVFMQLSDLLTGAIGYHNRGYNKVIAKNHIIEKIEKNSNTTLSKSTPKSTKKVNLFFIDLNKK